MENKRNRFSVVLKSAVIIAAAILAVVMVHKVETNTFSRLVSKMLDQYSFADNSRAADGSYLEIDTKPYDDEERAPAFSWLDTQVSSDSLDGIKFINEELGFSKALYTKMLETTALMGRQTEENDKYTVSWTYHPNKGLEVMYEKKQQTPGAAAVLKYIVVAVAAGTAAAVVITTVPSLVQKKRAGGNEKQEKRLPWTEIKSKIAALKTRVNIEIKKSAVLPVQLAAGEYILIRNEPCRMERFFVMITILPVMLILIVALLLAVLSESFEVFSYGFVSAFVICAISYYMYKLVVFILEHEELVVTNRRVFYRFFFRQIDLPIDVITAVGTNLFCILAVSTPCGIIRVPLIKNYREIHQFIVELLLQRQKEPGAVPVPPAEPVEEPAETAVPVTPEPDVEVTEVKDESPEPEVQETPAPEQTPEIKPTPVVSSGVKAIPQKTSATGTDPFASSVKYVPANSLEARGLRIGRCVMCRRIEIPVKMVPVMIAGVERKRTLCEKCAEKHAVTETLT